ncbi:N-formylglutamate deformylase [Rhodovibrionaceae bacterium A322]
MTVFSFTPGTLPLLMSIPHLGSEIPDEVAQQMLPEATGSADTDWYLDRLYDFATDLGYAVIRANYSRYVIDLNRDPSGVSLYPGANTTELCPTSTFAEEPLYPAGAQPDEAEITRRIETYWQPYHAKIADTLTSMQQEEGIALLFDSHSIRSHVPRFFDGRLPDFNLGTGGGTSCAAALEDSLAEGLRQDSRYETAVNGRFKGGYITRHFGQPDKQIHAFQLELSMATYSDEVLPQPAYNIERAAQVLPSLQLMLTRARDWVLDQQA